MKFNRKEALKFIDSNSFIEFFESQVEPINSGWVIYWKGKPIKPINGKNHYYASREAAIQGLDRNIGFGWSLIMNMASSYLGLDMSDSHYPDACKAYREYFRMDLLWTDQYHEGKLISHTCRDSKNLTEEEKQIRDERQKEKRSFESFCYNILKSQLIPKWEAEGLLEIKFI